MIFRLLIGIVLSVTIITLRPVRAESPTVVINELMWMGSSVSASDEWIELRNMTNTLVDIGGWSLSKKSSGNEVPMLTFPTGSTIEPNGYFLVSNYAIGPSSVLTVSPDVVTSDVALANTSLQIKLYDATQTLIDVADDGSGAPLAGEYSSAEQEYFSMERNILPGDGKIGSAWHTSSSVMDPLRNEHGTPRTENSNAVPVAKAGEDATGVVGVPIFFDGSESFDPDGGTLTMRWDFGDGSSADGATPTHAYQTVGTYNVLLTIDDGTVSITDELQVTVTPAALTTSTNTNVSVVSSVPVHEPVSCRGLQIVRIIPNPAGADTMESISLKNPTQQTIDVADCSLVAGTGRATLSEVPALDAGGTKVLTYQETHLRLPNSGATVELRDMDDQVLETVTYPIAKDDQVWIRTASGWAWDETTELIPTKSSTKNTNTARTTKQGKDVPVTNLTKLSELATLAPGDHVSFRGTVTAPLDLVGSGLVTLADESAGVMISLTTGAPFISVGDVIQGTGVVRQRDGVRRIASDSATLKIIDHQPMAPTSIEFDAIGIEDANRLISAEGFIVTVSGSRFDLDDGRDVVTVSIKSASGIVRPRMSPGDRATIVGILSVTTAGAKILPRSNDDVKIARVAGVDTVAPESLPADTPIGQLWYWVAATLGALLITLKPLIRLWRERLASGRAE